MGPIVEDIIVSEAHAHPNYIKIWFWLLILLAISVAGPMLEIPWVTVVTAFGIAAVKTFMVAAKFMHLQFEKKIIVVSIDNLRNISGGILFWGCGRDHEQFRATVERLHRRQYLY